MYKASRCYCSETVVHYSYYHKKNWLFLRNLVYDYLGTRMWRRGANLEGDTANFIETEQLLEVKGFRTSLLQVLSYHFILGPRYNACFYLLFSFPKETSRACFISVLASFAFWLIHLHISLWIIQEDILLFLLMYGYFGSALQVRGSIPLLWEQIVDLSYKPQLKLLNHEQTVAQSGVSFPLS